MSQELHSLTLPITSGGTTTPTEFSVDYLARKNGIVDTAENLMGDAENVEFTSRTVSGSGVSKAEKVSGNSYRYGVKNLYTPTLATTTLNGVTCTRNANATYTLNGTATANTYINLGEFSFVQGTQYRFVGAPPTASYTLGYMYTKYDATHYANDIGNGVTFTATETAPHQITIVVPNGAVVSSMVFKPMICTDTSATYADYEPHLDTPIVINNCTTGIKSVGVNLLPTTEFKNNTSAKKNVSVTFENSVYLYPGTYTWKTDTRANEGSINFYDENNVAISELSKGWWGQTKTATLTSLVKLKKLTVDVEANTTCYIQLEHSSTATQYKPYTTATLSLPLTTLTGTPTGGSTAEVMFGDGMVSVGNVADELLPTGTATKRFGKQTVTGSSGDTVTLTGCKTSATAYLCGDNIGTLANGVLTLTKTVSSVDVYYEKATPTEYTFSPITDTLTVEDGGTLEQLVPTGTEPTSAPFKGRMRLPVKVNKPMVAVPAPSANGTYKLTCTVSNGVATYSWVSA